METIKDLQDKLSLVLWVNRNLGKLCEVHGYSEEDDVVVLRMGRIAGYNVQDDNHTVIVEMFKTNQGWKMVDAEDMILIPPFTSSSYSYQVMNEINIIV